MKQNYLYFVIALLTLSLSCSTDDSHSEPLRFEEVTYDLSSVVTSQSVDIDGDNVLDGTDITNFVTCRSSFRIYERRCAFQIAAISNLALITTYSTDSPVTYQYLPQECFSYAIYENVSTTEDSIILQETTYTGDIVEHVFLKQGDKFVLNTKKTMKTTAISDENSGNLVTVSFIYEIQQPPI